MTDSPSTASTETDEPEADAIAALTADLFDEHAMLDLDTYLDLSEALGERPRFAILYALQIEGKLSANELGEALGRSENSLYSHLNRLVDSGLVENRKQERPDVDGLYSYYELTGLGADLIDAVTKFLGQEKTALEQSRLLFSTAKQRRGPGFSLRPLMGPKGRWLNCRTGGVGYESLHRLRRDTPFGGVVRSRR